MKIELLIGCSVRSIDLEDITNQLGDFFWLSAAVRMFWRHFWALGSWYLRISILSYEAFGNFSIMYLEIHHFVK